MAQPSLLREYKIIVVGGGGVGKSALTVRFIQDHFISEYDPTIEDSYRKQCVVDDEVALLDVLDTAGQEEYQAMQEQYMKTGEGFLVVYSITSRQSFDEVKGYVDSIKRVKDNDHVPLVIAGNKQDLEHERMVQDKEGRDFAAQHNAVFVGTSAKDNNMWNVDRAFHAVVREIRKYNKEQTFGGRSAIQNQWGHDNYDSQAHSDRNAGCCSGGCVIL